MYGAIGQIVLLTIVAGLLAAGITLPAIAIAGLATRDTANTFNNLPVGTLGNVPQISTMYDVEGKAIAKFYPGGIYRVPVTYDQISPVMRNAIVAIEDSTFYTQGALDPRGTARALFSNSSGGQLQGASTLAQQYVKNVRLLQAGNNKAAQNAAIYQNFSRKISQLRVAATVEHSMTPAGAAGRLPQRGVLRRAGLRHPGRGRAVLQRPGLQADPDRRPRTWPASCSRRPRMTRGSTRWRPATRRDEVLNRMMQLHYISKATATAAEQTPIKLKMSAAPLQTGCSSPLAARSAYFCDYVEHVLVNQYPQVWNQIIKGTGGLKIYTTLNMRDQTAASNAVNFVEPHWSDTYNPGRNADTEVLHAAGDRARSGPSRSTASTATVPARTRSTTPSTATTAAAGRACRPGSSSKIFTLITALKQGLPFGHQIKVISPATVGPYYDCHGGLAGGGSGAPPGYFSVVNSEGDTPKGGEFYQLYSGTVGSINVYFAKLEKQVGLCNVVKTAVDMGMTRADGKSLLKGDKIARPAYQYPADSDPELHPRLGRRLADEHGRRVRLGRGPRLVLRAEGAHQDRHQLGPAGEAAAQLVPPGHVQGRRGRGQLHPAGRPVRSGTAAGRGIGRPAAAKTGTANGGYYAAFAGYTPTLAGYVSVFNPINPTTAGAMVGSNSCFRQVRISPGTGVQSAPARCTATTRLAQPGSTPSCTPSLAGPIPFVTVPSNSIFFSQGLGNAPKAVSQPKKKKGHGPGGPGGGPPPKITPPPPPPH